MDRRTGRRAPLWPSSQAGAPSHSRSQAKPAAPEGTRFSSGSSARPISAIEAYPHVWVRIGEVGKLFAALKERAIAEMVIIGAMTRPDFADLSLDWGAVKRAAGLAQLFRRGDNGLLAGLAAIIEREGVRVVGAHEVAPRLLAPSGPIGARAPPREDDTDIAFGARLLGALSTFDAGQGAIVAAGRVLAIEAAEGTDAMLARVAEMRANGRLRLSGLAGVLVKAPKRGQDLRLDMPAVGPNDD